MFDWFRKMFGNSEQPRRRRHEQQPEPIRRNPPAKIPPIRDEQMPFQPDLQKRAADFLRRAIPAELQPHYVSGSLADVIVTHCAQDQPLDPELREIAEISANEYDHSIANAQTTELKAYYTECQQLLREIIRVSR